MEKFYSCGLLAKFGFYNQFLVFKAKIGPSAFMQSVLFCFSKYKLLKNYFPKIYIGRGPISKHSTPRVSPISQTNNKHTSQGQRQTPKIASVSLHRIALWLLAHINTRLPFLLMNVGLVPQNFKNKKHRVTLCAQVSTRVYVSSNG